MTYEGTGTQAVFDVPFDYLKGSFVIAAVDDTTLDYVVANRQVTFSPAPASGTLIVIKRQTSTERLVSWQDASVLKASDMTLAQVQQLHILEEQQDWIKTNSMVTDDENRWNALNHRIINVSDPINDQDAVTKNYVENLGNSFKTLLDTTTTQDIQRLESKTQEGLAALDLQTTLDLETLKALSEEMKEIAKDVNVFIPSVTENIISWTNKAGLPNPDPVNIKGEQGSPGKDGTAATITIGTVTTGEPGSNASVTNVGTDTAAVLDISIPRGDKGVDGTGAGDVIAAADNTFTATNTFDGILKTKSDMQAVGSLPTVLQRGDSNIQTYTLKNGLNRSVVFRDTGDMTGYAKTFIISVARSGGTGTFSIGSNNGIGANTPTVYMVDGALPDIVDGEVLKIAMEVNEPANAIFIYILGKVAL
ncbi:phage tail fiber domain-containing protein [Phascolarctobacterium faecium]|uniref:phage tail fiber domain-containing protein n=1 Tax=Phascolarctobacterium faecium TaxID=33025 RepID=UPI00351F9F52